MTPEIIVTIVFVSVFISVILAVKLFINVVKMTVADINSKDNSSIDKKVSDILERASKNEHGLYTEKQLESVNKGIAKLKGDK